MHVRGRTLSTLVLTFLPQCRLDLELEELSFVVRVLLGRSLLSARPPPCVELDAVLTVTEMH